MTGISTDCDQETAGREMSWNFWKRPICMCSVLLPRNSYWTVKCPKF